MGRINPLILIGVPTWGRVSTRWARGYRHLGGPLGATMGEIEVQETAIAEARNALMRTAIEQGAEYLFMLGDDVIPPGDAISTLLQRMWDNPDVHLATGIYWTKGWPTQPYLWRAMQRGPYLDWKAGEWFDVDFAGCDCLLIRLSPEVKALGPEWFSTEWLWNDEEKPGGLLTEDFYFYTKARKAGLKLWVDSSVQCLHEDRQTGMVFGLTSEMPQSGYIDELPALPEGSTDVAPLVKVADIGAGKDTPFFGHADAVKVVRFDGDEKTAPDYRCDLRKLPVPDQSFDVVHSRHVLEHFARAEAPKVLAEWARILRVGGELRVCVPNTLNAMRAIIEIEEGKRDPDHYPWWQLYGEQTDQRDYHANGFSVRRLRALLGAVGLTDIVVEEGDEGRNLYGTAKKVAHPKPWRLVEEWEAIAAAEGRTIPGMTSDPLPATPEAATPVNDPAKEREAALFNTGQIASLRGPYSGNGNMAAVHEPVAVAD